MQYQLNDPITVLNLLTQPQFQTNKQSTFNLDDYYLGDYQFLTVPHLNTEDLAMQLVYDARDIFRGAYQTKNRYHQTEMHLKHVSINQQQNIMYALADELIRHFNVAKNNDALTWDGQIISLLNSAVLTDNNDYLYYFKYDLHQALNSNKIMVPMQIYQIPIANQTDFETWLLTQFKKKPFLPDFEAFNALKDFWMQQAKQINNLKIDKQQSTSAVDKTKLVNPSLLKVLKSIANAKKTDKTALPVILTYQDLINFYHEIQNQHLTSQTQTVQDWLFSQLAGTNKLESLIDLVSINAHFKHLNQTFKIVPNNQPIYRQLMQQFSQDKNWSNRKFNGMRIYQVDNLDNRDAKFSHHLTLIHGTKNYSIPTLLCDGFKTIAELKQDDNSQFKNTAQGLGPGTYFARLNQVTKAINYTDELKYLLVTDVAYQKVYQANNYGIPHTDADLIYGNKVGVKYGYDEFVAKYPQQQTQIKYLVELIN